MKKPKISIIVSAYNNRKDIAKSIESILHQDFRDFELLIMDDGSTDGTGKIIDRYAEKDYRIRAFHRKNKGLVASLNELISHARTDLIARQDADDISYPDRIGQQYSYMKKNPGTVLLGCRFKMITGKEDIENKSCFGPDFINRWFLIVNNPFVHSSVMFRKKEFVKAGGYRKEFYPAEDYALWSALKRFGKIENMEETLGEYYFNPKGISSKNIASQTERRIALNRINFDDLYEAGQIPSPSKIKQYFRKNLPTATQRRAIGRLACLTGCYMVTKKDYAPARRFFRLSLFFYGKSIDSFLNLFLIHINRAIYISADFYGKKIPILKIRWFGLSREKR